MQPAHGKTLAKLPPVADTEDHLLEPYLLGYHYIELDLAHHQPMQEVEAEESAISTKSPDGYLSRQLVQHGSQEILCLTGTGTVARPEHTSEIIPGLSYEAHKGMVAGPATLLGIVTLLALCCLPAAGRPAKDRYDVGIQVQGDGFHVTKSPADFIQLPEIDLCHMLSLVNRDPGKKTADRTLGGKPGKAGRPLNPNYALQTPNNNEQIEKSVSYGVLSSLECSPKRCIPPELKIVRYLKPQGAANFAKSALLSGT